MKLAWRTWPWRRVALLLAASLLLHLGVLHMVARRFGLNAPTADIEPPLTLRMSRPAPPAAGTAAPTPAPAPAPARDAPRIAALPAFGLAMPRSFNGAEMADVPAGYGNAAPPSVHITYRSGQADASLSWTRDGDAYTLELDEGKHLMRSAGQVSDVGIAPARFEDLGRSITFDRDKGRLDLGDDAEPLRVPQDAQDPASVLMQLAALGMRAGGLPRGDLVFFVGAPGSAAVVRFRQLGDEDIATPLGKLHTRHLVQAGDSGMALDVWLAPERGWLPVQLRRRWPGGSSTLVARRIDTP